MRIIFMGTPPFAVPALRRLHADGHDVAAVYTQPPRPARRGKKPRLSAVHVAADALGVEVRTPPSLKDAAVQKDFAALGGEIAVVAAYGLILPPAILRAPTHGCLNIHASLLPRWRGAAPVQRAILAGDRVTGVTIMQMEAGLDTGPMLLTRQVEIAGKTAGMLTDELAIVGADLCAAALGDFPEVVPEPQTDENATYAAKIDKAETRLDWRDAAVNVERRVRAFNPVPGAWFEICGERVKVLEVEVVEGDGTAGEVREEGRVIACGSGAVRLRLVQRAGKRPMRMEDFLNGFTMPARL